MYRLNHRTISIGKVQGVTLPVRLTNLRSEESTRASLKVIYTTASTTYSPLHLLVPSPRRHGNLPCVTVTLGTLASLIYFIGVYYIASFLLLPLLHPPHWCLTHLVGCRAARQSGLNCKLCLRLFVCRVCRRSAAWWVERRVRLENYTLN